MLRLTENGYYQVEEWQGLDWLRHGFGTRDTVGMPGALATVKQIHSAEVLLTEEPGLRGTGDGLITNTPGLHVGVKTADCVPILLIDRANRVVAAVHAGWRGTLAGIASKAVALMVNNFGANPAHLEAAIGPAIGHCCFEVGAEVAREFGPWPCDEKTHLDLAAINSSQLETAGVCRIYQANLCTMCGEGFFSFRRDREAAGRMISFTGVGAGVGKRAL